MKDITMKIVRSELMTAFGLSERDTIRLSARNREVVGVNIGQILHLKTKGDATVISLVVKPAFIADAMMDAMRKPSNTAYVSQGTLNRLDLANEVTEVRPAERVTLGCDPECLIIQPNGKVIDASTCGIGSKTTDVGHDGVLLEFRPRPSTDANTLTDNLYKLILKARGLINTNKYLKDPQNSRLSACSYYDDGRWKLSVGFHIHFGIPGILLSDRRNLITNQIVKVLDYYLAIPSVVIEGNDHIRRTSLHIPYGKPGEYRAEYPTLEYRVLGGHILRHPIISKGALTLGLLVVEDALSRIKVITKNYSDYSRVYDHSDLVKIYPHIPTDPLNICQPLCRESTKLARKHIDMIMRDVECMMNYDQGETKTVLAEFFDCILSGKQFEQDIEANWRISYECANRQRQLAVHKAPVGGLRSNAG